MRILLLTVSVITAGVVNAQPAPGDGAAAAREGGFLSRFRGTNSAAVRESNVARESREVAQPANTQQRYQPGVTYPQQTARQPQQTAPQQFQQPNPAYQQAAPQQGAPGQVPVMPQPGQATPPAGQQVRRTETGTRSGSNSESNSPQRTRSTPAPKRDASEPTEKKEAATRESNETKTAKESTGSSKNSKSGSSDGPSALEKIVNKVEQKNEQDAKPSKSEAQQKKDAERAAAKAAEEEDKAAKAAAKAEAEANKAADEATTVVARFLKSANDGMYSKASDDLTAELQKYFGSEISAVNGSLKTVLDRLTHSGTITMVTYANTIVRGEGAVVEAELTFDNGTAQRHNFDLVRDKEEWNIILPIARQDGTRAESAGSAAPQAPEVKAVAASPAATPAPTAAVNPLDASTTAAAAAGAPPAQ